MNLIRVLHLYDSFVHGHSITEGRMKYSKITYKKIKESIVNQQTINGALVFDISTVNLSMNFHT